MEKELSINKNAIGKAIDSLRDTAGEIQAEVEKTGGRSGLETLERYRKDFERMSAVMESYLALLDEDCKRLEQTVNVLFRFEADLLTESLAERGPVGQ